MTSKLINQENAFFKPTLKWHSKYCKTQISVDRRCMVVLLLLPQLQLVVQLVRMQYKYTVPVVFSNIEILSSESTILLFKQDHTTTSESYLRTYAFSLN